jgi:hypothetical protein
MSRQQTKRRVARDRRMAAVHEAGHVVVARRFDLEILSAWIVPNDAGPEERTWRGGVLIKKAGAPEMVCRMVGCAGAVAEWLWGGNWIEDFYLDGMSEADWLIAGCAEGCPDDALMDAVQQVGKLFERCGAGWQELVAEARRLIVDSR